jgi:hypothetical protein
MNPPLLEWCPWRGLQFDRLSWQLLGRHLKAPLLLQQVALHASVNPSAGLTVQHYSCTTIQEHPEQLDYMRAQRCARWSTLLPGARGLDAGAKAALAACSPPVGGCIGFAMPLSASSSALNHMHTG